MHPVLKNAIDNPRIAGTYGSDRGDYGLEDSVISIDTFFRRNSHIMFLKHDNDNDKQTLTASRTHKNAEWRRNKFQ